MPINGWYRAVSLIIRELLYCVVALMAAVLRVRKLVRLVFSDVAFKSISFGMNNGSAEIATISL